jgi:ATP-binding cassette subfamily B protein
MRPPPPKPEELPQSWRDRISALRNVGPLLRLVWQTNPRLCIATLLLRLAAAFLPLAMLWIPKLIIDLVVRALRHEVIDKPLIFKLLILELLLAILSDALSRSISLVDSLLGDQFTNHVSIRLVEHADSLDLLSFEDPVFYDKLERARRQTTARLGMLATLAGMAQQTITLVTMISAVVLYSPWLLLLLVGSTVPVFLGETRFALLNYSILFRYTPERRELD